MRLSRKNKKVLAMFKRRHKYQRVTKRLIWGDSGLRLLSRLMMPRRRLYWIRVWMKWHYKLFHRRYTRRIKRRGRYFWIRLRNCMPCTRKSDKSRMGKGKGKLVGWYCNLTPGHFFMEFRTSRFQIVKPLFEYFRRRFSARVQGVLRESYRTTALYSGTHGSIGVFQNWRVYSYARFRHSTRFVRKYSRRKIDLIK